MATFPAIQASELPIDCLIETTNNQVYRVCEIGQRDLEHCWFGVKQKWTKKGWMDVQNPKVELVRKIAARRIEVQRT